VPETSEFIRAAEPARTYRLVRLHCAASSLVKTHRVAMSDRTRRGAAEKFQPKIQNVFYVKTNQASICGSRVQKFYNYILRLQNKRKDKFFPLLIDIFNKLYKLLILSFITFYKILLVTKINISSCLSCLFAGLQKSSSSAWKVQHPSLDAASHLYDLSVPLSFLAAEIIFANEPR